MSLDITLSSALQRRLVDGLIDLHPQPWRVEPESEMLCGVVDAKKKLVLMCADESEAVELIRAAMAVTVANASADLDVDRITRLEGAAATKPKSASDLFDKLLPAALTKNPDKARALNATYGFRVTGDKGGEWTVDCTVAKPTCTRGSASPTGTGAMCAMCAIVVSDSDMMAIIKDPNMAMQLYFQGKLVVSGDPTLAMKMQQLFALVMPE